MAGRSVRDLLRFQPGKQALADIDPGRSPGIRKAAAKCAQPRDAEKLQALHERLYAENKRSLLLVLQGMDTSGKAGTITHVIGAIDPAGVRITAFKAPSPEERQHDFLWRIRKGLPRPREIGIFDRSHYEDVLIARVRELAPRAVLAKRYGAINRFEREVTGSGTAIVKIFLHISHDEQRERLIARLLDPTKHWKFNPKDIDERGVWDAYQAAYEIALSRCSTRTAPWYVVPANKKWYRNWAIGRILVETLEELDPQYPKSDLDVRALVARLRSESG